MQSLSGPFILDWGGVTYDLTTITLAETERKLLKPVQTSVIPLLVLAFYWEINYEK